MPNGPWHSRRTSAGWNGRLSCFTAARGTWTSGSGAVRPKSVPFSVAMTTDWGAICRGVGGGVAGVGVAVESQAVRPGGW